MGNLQTHGKHNCGANFRFSAVASWEFGSLVFIDEKSLVENE